MDGTACCLRDHSRLPIELRPLDHQSFADETRCGSRNYSDWHSLDATWPYTEFQLTFPEYSVEEQRITGNCFHYNRIEATRPPIPAKVAYLAFQVPANAYVYLGTLNLVDAHLAPSAIGHAFIAPRRATVYFGDYVFVGNKTVEFRRDIDAARAGTRELLPRDAALELAEATTAPGAHMFICTP
jgi:hypothetical protein